MARIVIELSEEQEEFIRKQAAEAGLGDPAEYVLSLVSEAERASVMAWLEAEVRKGLESGNPVEATPEFWAERHRRACLCDRGRGQQVHEVGLRRLGPFLESAQAAFAFSLQRFPTARPCRPAGREQRPGFQRTYCTPTNLLPARPPSAAGH